MAIATDIAIDVSGNIYYTGAVHGAAGAGYYSVIEFHRYLQDLADDAVASGDDLIDITSDTPSDRSTDNIVQVLTGFRLDDVSGTEAISEHLFDGSIIQQENGTIWDGLVVIAAEGMDLQVIQGGVLVANDFWNTTPDGEASKGLNRDVANGISHRFMLEVNTAGADIDGRRIIGITREVGQTFSEFKVNGTARGNNVLALTYANDLNDATDASSRVAITNANEGYVLLDIDGDSTPEAYYSEWNRDTYTINEFYERMKYISAAESGGSATSPNDTLYGLDGNVFRGITHQIAYTGLAGGTFADSTVVNFANGATAQILADDGADTFWCQILTGVIPGSGGVTQGGVTASVSAITERTLATPFVGLSTGTALIGAYGIGMEITDVTAADILTDLESFTRNPPNNVSFTVGGLVSTEDRVLVGPATGGIIQPDQGSVDQTLTGGESTVVMASNVEALGTSTPSATDTPVTGQLRVEGNDGVYYLVPFTGRSFGAGAITFTGCTSVPAAAAGNNCYIAYIDELAAGSSASFTVVYSAPRSLFIRVRDGGTAGDIEGIKTFETTGTLGSAGGSTTAIRTSDA